jgi:hypothetical protein
MQEKFEHSEPKNLKTSDQKLIANRQFCLTGMLASWGKSVVLVMEGGVAGYVSGLALIKCGVTEGKWLFIPIGVCGLINACTLIVTVYPSHYAHKLEFVRDKILEGIEGAYLLTLTISEMIEFFYHHELDYKIYIPVTLFATITSGIINYFSPSHHLLSTNSLKQLFPKILHGAITMATNPAGMIHMFVDNLNLMTKQAAFYSYISLFFLGGVREIFRPRMAHKMNTIMDTILKLPKYGSVSILMMLLMNNLYVLETNNSDVPENYFYPYTVMPALFLFILQFVLHLITDCETVDEKISHTDTVDVETRALISENPVSENPGAGIPKNYTDLRAKICASLIAENVSSVKNKEKLLHYSATVITATQESPGF